MCWNRMRVSGGGGCAAGFLPGNINIEQPRPVLLSNGFATDSVDRTIKIGVDFHVRMSTFCIGVVPMAFDPPKGACS